MTDSTVLGTTPGTEKGLNKCSLTDLKIKFQIQFIHKLGVNCIQMVSFSNPVKIASFCLKQNYAMLKVEHSFFESFHTVKFNFFKCISWKSIK